MLAIKLLDRILNDDENLLRHEGGNNEVMVFRNIEQITEFLESKEAVRRKIRIHKIRIVRW
jgi:DNA-binding transcriptional regulator WhiA